MNMADVYQNLYEIVKMRGASFSDIANTMGISRQSLSRVINEKTLTVKRLEEICGILKIEPAILWSDNIRIFELNEELIKNGNQTASHVSNKTNIDTEKADDNIVDRLLDQIEILNKTVNNQVDIIKNLSKK